jgi:hypothetical protein
MVTKAQIAKLPVEQQEILAQIELSKTRRRQKLLELARGRDWRSRYFPLYIFAVFLIFITFYYFDCFHVQEKPFILYLPLGMGFVFSLISYMTRTDRRLDALIELLDFDHKNQDDSNNSKNEKTG